MAVSELPGTLTLVIGTLLAGSASDGELTIVAGGESAYRIVVPAEPTPEESYAAAQLRKYVRMATGATLDVEQGVDPRGMTAIVVARADVEPARSLLKAPGLPALPAHEEAVLVARVGGALPEHVDVWIYGHDLDGDRTGPEHDVHLAEASGERRHIGILSPPDVRGNRANTCIVLPKVPISEAATPAASPLLDEFPATTGSRPGKRKSPQGE